MIFSRFIPSRAPSIVKAGIESFIKNPGEKIFVLKISAPKKIMIKIITPSIIPPKRYFCPLIFDIINAETKEEINKEAIEITSIILFGFSVL